MNKGLRQEIKSRKFKKRLEENRIAPNAKGNFYAFKSHGKPCSCSFCKDEKFRDDRKKHNWKGMHFNYGF